MTPEPILALALPPAVAVALWLLGPRYRAARAVTLATALVLVLSAARLVWLASADEVIVHALGDWLPPFGIVLVADRLSALFLLVQALVLVAAVGMLRRESHGEATVTRAYPLLLMLTMGLNGAFLTGDLFNLFVMFELVLLSSYLLLQVPGTSRSVRAAFSNVLVNLVASAFFFAGVGILYGLTGSVNMADVGARIGNAPPGLRLAACAMLATAFGVKAALVPVVFWLPATYPTLAGPVAALFAGMMTKLGVYALLRTTPLLMQGTAVPDVLVVLGGASALLGVLMALAQYEIRRLLGFHIVSQVGYMVLGLGLLTVAGLAGAIFYLSHHILVKATLYFVADELERVNGSRDIRAMSWRRAGGTALAFAFLTAAFSLAGVPPFSGFFAKLGLFRAAFGVDGWLSLLVLVIASFFTLASMLKIWGFAFQAKPDGEAAGAGPRPARRLAPVYVLVAASLALATLAGPTFRYAEATARQLLDVDGYAARVIGGASR